MNGWLFIEQDSKINGVYQFITEQLDSRVHGDSCSARGV